MRVTGSAVRPLAILTAALLSSAIAAPAFAQIEQVVVTAQKRAEDVQTVPIAITKLTMCVTSRSRYAPFMGTTTSPERNAATCAITSSALVTVDMRTRSPRARPARAKRPATARDRASSSLALIHVPLSQSTRRVPSVAHWRAHADGSERDRSRSTDAGSTPGGR